MASPSSNLKSSAANPSTTLETVWLEAWKKQDLAELHAAIDRQLALLGQQKIVRVDEFCEGWTRDILDYSQEYPWEAGELALMDRGVSWKTLMSGEHAFPASRLQLLDRHKNNIPAKTLERLRRKSIFRSDPVTFETVIRLEIERGYHISWQDLGEQVLYFSFSNPQKCTPLFDVLFRLHSITMKGSDRAGTYLQKTYGSYGDKIPLLIAAYFTPSCPADPEKGVGKLITPAFIGAIKHDQAYSDDQNSNSLLDLLMENSAFLRRHREDRDFVQKMKWLLEQGATHDPNTSKVSPVDMAASQHASIELAQLLEKYGYTHSPDVLIRWLMAFEKSSRQEEMFHFWLNKTDTRFLNQASEHWEAPPLHLILLNRFVRRIKHPNCIPEEWVKPLLALGADPNVRDPQGRNALHFCEDRRTSPDTIMALLAAGADPDAVDQNGRKPKATLIEMAREERRLKMDAKTIRHQNQGAATKANEADPESTLSSVNAKEKAASTAAFSPRKPRTV